MINLLPPTNLRELRAGRHNSVLLSYTIAAAVIVGVIIFVYLSMFVLLRSTESTNTELSDTSRQKIAQLKTVEQQTKTYTANLKLAKSLFNNRASYTKALHAVAVALPAGTVAQSLDLNPETIGQPTSLTFLAKSTEQALAIKQQLESSQVATAITIASLTENNSEGGDAAYPVSLTLNLTLNPSIFTTEDTNA